MADFDYNPMMGSVRPCKFFMSPMGCRYGASCRFMHFDGGAQQQAAMAQGMGIPTMMPPQGPVMMTPNPIYMSNHGGGGYGGPPMEPRGIPCRFFNSMGCRNGDRCPYLHVQETQVSSKQYSEMTEEQKNSDKSRRVRLKLPGLQVLKCSVCRGDFVRRPGGDRDIREVLKEHYEQMFYARDKNHISYLEQDIFKCDEKHPHVTCPAENCWQQFPHVLDMIYHLGEKSDVTKKTPDRESFQHQFCLSAIARHFAWRDTLIHLNIDEYDSDEDKAKTLHNFNMELYGLLNLGNDETAEDKHNQQIEDAIDDEIEDAIEKEMAKEMMKLKLEEKHGKEKAAEMMKDYDASKDFDVSNDAGDDSAEYGGHDFTDDEILELAAQGIKPTDPEARAALDMLKSNGATGF